MFCFVAFAFGELGQLSGPRLDLGESGQLLVGHRRELPGSVGGLPGCLGEHLGLVKGRDQAVDAEHAAQVRPQVEASGLGEHGVAVQHRQAGQEGGLGAVLLDQQRLQALGPDGLAIDLDGGRRGASLRAVRARDVQDTTTRQLDLD